MSESFSVVIKKYPKKIVWLDTNFVINLAKGRNDQTRERMEKLFDFLKLNEEEFFVVEGDDTELRLGNGETKEYSQLLSTLSHGVSFLPYEAIEQFQFQASVVAKKEGVYPIILDASRYISSDPVKALEDAKKCGFIVGVNYRCSSSEVMAETTKQDIFKELVEKRPKGVSIADQQRLESLSSAKLCKEFITASINEAKATLHLSVDDALKKMKNSILPNNEVIFNLMQWWNYSGGEKNDHELLLRFLESKEFTDMPFNFISSMLWGAIYAGPQKLDLGDYWDVKHMSAILPFSNIVFTDKAAERRLKLYKLGEKYQTEIYSMSTMDEFFKKYN